MTKDRLLTVAVASVSAVGFVTLLVPVKPAGGILAFLLARLARPSPKIGRRGKAAYRCYTRYHCYVHLPGYTCGVEPGRCRGSQGQRVTSGQSMPGVAGWLLGAVRWEHRRSTGGLSTP